MNESATKELWDRLASRQIDFIRFFYHRFFEHFPEYRRLFPKKMDAQMEKMVEMTSAVLRHSNNIPQIRPYLLQISETHRSFGIKRKDLVNFKAVFIGTAAKFFGDAWQKNYEDEFENAFDNAIIPILVEGLRL